MTGLIHRNCSPAWIAAAIAVAWTFASAAQAPPPASEADAAYARHDWPAAERLYDSLTHQDPANARYWYRLGVSERGNQHYAPALEAFKKAGELGAGKGLPQSLVDYELATTNAGMGERAHAVELLRKAADAGFLQPDRLDNDSEWSALRADPQFVAAAKIVRHNARPCDDPEFAQFDFWLGDWDVTSTANGQPRGASHIAKEMGGCVVWENWTSAGSPYFGKSYNTYNVNQKRWEQYWVDNFAGVMFFYGNLKDGVMDYWTDDTPQPDGKALRRHLQFFNLGSNKVRQFSQGSTDGGKTWNVEYDLTYTKRADTSGSSGAAESKSAGSRQ